MPSKRTVILPLVFASAFLVSAAVPAMAQGPQKGWEYKFTIYGWLPTIEGTLTYDVPGISNPVKADAGDILDSLEMTFMGSFSARKGRWGFVTDLIYLNMGNSKDGSVQVPILLGTQTHLVNVGAKMDLTGWLVQGAATWTAVETERGRLDVLFGVRYLDLSTDLTLNFQGITPIPTAYHDHTFSASGNWWNAIVGIKGDVVLGGNWFMPYYLDAGTGDSNFTWQGMLGVGYSWSVCDLSVAYRYLSFDQGGGGALKDLDLGGGVIGLSFKW